MFTRMSFTITMFIFFAGIICLFMFSCENLSQGQIEPQEPYRSTAQVQSAIQILQVGEFLGEVSAESGEVWLGLYPTENGYALIPSELVLEPFYDPLIDDDENQPDATRISVDAQAEPLFLVTGCEALQPGTVKTLFSGRMPMALGSFLEFTFEDRDDYSITAFGDLTLNSSAYDYKIELSKGDRSQVIFSFDSTTDAVPLLLWAGDLDRDGQLDLLVDTIYNYAASGPTLFLSSAVQDDSLLQQVAQFAITC